jgi:hypothetical protein
MDTVVMNSKWALEYMTDEAITNPARHNSYSPNQIIHNRRRIGGNKFCKEICNNVVHLCITNFAMVECDQTFARMLLLCHRSFSKLEGLVFQGHMYSVKSLPRGKQRVKLAKKVQKPRFSLHKVIAIDAPSI